MRANRVEFIWFPNCKYQMPFITDVLGKAVISFYIECIGIFVISISSFEMHVTFNLASDFENNIISVSYSLFLWIALLITFICCCCDSRKDSFNAFIAAWVIRVAHLLVLIAINILFILLNDFSVFFSNLWHVFT